jgi:hypothetical protein
MSSDDISRLAGESPESALERKRLEEKCNILNAGLKGLKGLENQRYFVHRAEETPVSSEDVESNLDEASFVSEEASTISSSRGASPVMDP